MTTILPDPWTPFGLRSNPHFQEPLSIESTADRVALRLGMTQAGASAVVARLDAGGRPALRRRRRAQSLLSRDR